MSTTSVATTTLLNTENEPKYLSRANVIPKKSDDKAVVVNNLINIIEKEYQRGNQSISKDKIEYLLEYKKKQQQQQQKPALPPPLYPPLFNKFNISEQKAKPTKKQIPPATNSKLKRPRQPLTFKKIESIVISILEGLANILDNLHLFSKFPMFPQRLVQLLKQTNKLWVLILVFLIRKTISQLLNLIRKENKIKAELSILKSSKNSKLLEQTEENEHPTTIEENGKMVQVHTYGGGGILNKYQKILKDLKFDKVMLIIELIGNFLDLTFNLVELYEWPVPGWFMSGLNVASMAMTIYRMNKDDEYVDDSVEDELI